MPIPDSAPRVVIEGVEPEIDAGRFPIKRTAGDEVVVEADVFADGDDLLWALLLHRKEGDDAWQETSMTALVNDRWRGAFAVDALGYHEYTILAGVDAFGTWRQDLRKKVDAGQDVAVELLMGADLLVEAAARAGGGDAAALRRHAAALRADRPQAERVAAALDEAVASVAARYRDRAHATRYERDLRVWLDRAQARFSTWYELFPRSTATKAGRHGTFKDVEARLPYVASMGFDVLYLPPIHPVGRTFRKGKNNSLNPEPNEPGSPWAIGGPEGGHKAIHPDLGTLEDFRRLVARAPEHGMEVALDIAFQCSPDHPYAKEHPEWFHKRPDGTIQYAENPPKKYQDIYPFDFECENWRELWIELKSVLDFWIDQGVKIFRVDNPHTKSFAFWEWAIAEVRAVHPEVIFLSEAFTRPKPMYRLAKLGFTQSYTYFAWRNMKWDLTQYFMELTKTKVREFFRPNLWPNTPDILTEQLQYGGRPAFMARLALAATLGASYGIYGPSFELMVHTPREHGSEEYLDSEKYEIKYWDLDRPDSLREYIALVNDARRQNPALQSDDFLAFHGIDNDQLVCYSKRTANRENVVLIVVNLDAHHTQSGWTGLDLAELGVQSGEQFQVHDLLTDARYIWSGSRNYVELNPHSVPVHLFRVSRRLLSEQDFDYFM